MKDVKRTFIIGEEWLYYKIYCGNYSADNILIETVNPIVAELQKRKLVDYWFFVRYEDPENHLRLRFHLSQTETIQEVIQIMLPRFSKLIREDIAYEINIGTYKREIERYGSNTIVEVEKIFYYQSQKILKLIRETLPENDEIVRIFAALKNINDLFEHFKISLTQRQNFVQERCDYFRSEHGIEKHNVKKMSSLYSNYRSDIFLMLYHKEDPMYLEGLLEILNNNDQETQNIKTIYSKIIKNKTVDLLNLANSLIHMNVNRLFRSKQRQYEMLCYDFMNKYYKTLIAKK